MKRSVETSTLIHQRAQQIVPERIQKIRKAIQDRNFELFARLTMEDSNQMHAICLDTYPPCVYMNQISHQIVRLVHQINKHSSQIKVCYTFDAGPNACLYLEEENLALVAGLINHFFPQALDQVDDYFRGEIVKLEQPSKVRFRKVSDKVQI